MVMDMDEYMILDQDLGTDPVGPIDRQMKAFIDYAINAYFERRDSSFKIEERRGPETILVEDWLGCTTTDAVHDTFNYPSLDRNLTIWSWSRCFADKMGPFRSCELEDCSEKFGIELRLNDALKCVKSVIQCGLNDDRSLPVYGCVLLEHKATKARGFVIYDLCHSSPGCKFDVYSRPSEVNFVVLLKECIEHYRTNENFYERACLSFECGQLQFTSHDRVSWDDVVVPESIKTSIAKNSVAVLKNAELIYKRGLSPNRNTLLVSPPGMAKTTIFKAVSNDLEGVATRIWCTGKSILSSEDVSDLFKCARSLAPAVVFVEDMDLFGKDRSNSNNGYILNEFLNCLDGLHKNPGIVVMASTNDHDSMDKALTHRPGRFDVKLKMPFPSAGERSEILLRALGKLGLDVISSVSKDDWDTVVELTEGMTGAYLAEIAKSCFLNAIDRTQDETCSCFTIEDMRSACEQVLNNINMTGC